MAKIEVNALPNKKGDVFYLAKWGLFAPLFCSCVLWFALQLQHSYFYFSDTYLLYIRIIATIIDIIAFIKIFRFYNYFSKACKCLGKSIHNLTKVFAYCFLFGFLILPGIIAFIVFLILAIKFIMNYTGLLERTGKRMLLSCIVSGCLFILLGIILLGILSLYYSYQTDNISPGLLSFISGGRFVGIAILIIMIGLGIWGWIIQYRLFSIMNLLMENGYNEYYEKHLNQIFGTSTESSESGNVAAMTPAPPTQIEIVYEQPKNNRKKIWIVTGIVLACGAVTALVISIVNNIADGPMKELELGITAYNNFSNILSRSKCFIS